jgi:hypothetical protein
MRALTNPMCRSPARFVATTFAYLCFMAGDADRVREVAPAHARHWQALELARYRGGPFADRTGGLVEFEAS